MSLSSTDRRRRGRRAFSEINITPFTDVILVLLIIFMVTAQFINHAERGMDLNLPTATEVESLDALGGIRIRIDREGVLTLDGESTAFETLEGDLRAAMQSPDQLVIVEGDRETVLQNVVAIMDAALAVGMPNIVLATAADEAGDQPPTDRAEIEQADPGLPVEPPDSPFVSPPAPG